MSTARASAAKKTACSLQSPTRLLSTSRALGTERVGDFARFSKTQLLSAVLCRHPRPLGHLFRLLADLGVVGLDEGIGADGRLSSSSDKTSRPV